MRENYGKTLKTIRTNLNLSQSEVSKGIMSQSNYSKIEKGEIEISFYHIVQLVTRYNMTVDEFLWMHNKGKTIYYALDVLSTIDVNEENIIKVKQDISSQKSLSKFDDEILLIMDAKLLLQKNEWDEAKRLVQPIWDRLQNQDAFYYYDLFILNSILYIFPLTTAEYMYNLAVERVNKIYNFKDSTSLLGNIQNNLILMMIEERKYELALVKLNETIPELLRKNHLLKLATAYIRKGYILKVLDIEDEEFLLKKGFRILEWSHQYTRLNSLRDEVKKHTGIKAESKT